MTDGLIIVDHGSRLNQSNQLLDQLVEAFVKRFAGLYTIVEPAHMDIAEPSIPTAYGRCVERGAARIVVCPYFLGPGKHRTTDIPCLAAEAQRRFPHTTFRITPSLGIDDLMLDLLRKRIEQPDESI